MPCDDSNSPSVDNSQQLTVKVRLFIANLYKYPDITRKRADKVMCEVYLKLFCEFPGMLEKTWQYLNAVTENTELITNVIQCSLWKQKILNSSDTIWIPLVGYFDDYENNNPLSSHKGIRKCEAVYINVALLPPEIYSKINNIFLLRFFNSKHWV